MEATRVHRRHARPLPARARTRTPTRRAVHPGVPVSHREGPRRRSSPLGSGVRLVKGAYNEPPDKAYPEEVGRRRELLQARARCSSRPRPARRASARSSARTIPSSSGGSRSTGAPQDLPPSALEFQMLYGIRRQEQERARARPATVPRADQLRRGLVRVVHAAPGRAAGQRALRRQDDVRAVGRHRRGLLRRPVSASRGSTRSASVRVFAGG